MRPSPKLRGALLSLVFLAAAGRLCAQDALDGGANFFLAGRLDNAITFFSAAIKENPNDSRAKEILVYCLVIKGKEALRDGQYAQARAALAAAEEFLPQNRELKILGLLAEMEESAPTPSVSISTAIASLETTAEINSVFECLFGDGPCAKGGRYTVHMVWEGETMADIAMIYYNDFTKWEKIWAANPQVANPHRLEKGVKLLIPLDK
ncbi:MAG: LysM peptidoglycan-binding domain-containing protein [Elusimicrobiota bacterium]|nr:LysM peptidoglycan-binding domain-containing protein [Elusimicrobiota bacterium]